MQRKSYGSSVFGVILPGVGGLHIVSSRLVDASLLSPSSRKDVRNTVTRATTGKIATALSACALLALVRLASADAASITVLDLKLNEVGGAVTASDTSGLSHNGVIGSHLTMNGAFADWDRHPPGEGVYYGSSHLITVPDAADGSLDPGTGNFSVEMRFRTKENFGNVIQKGQARTVGGQVKFQIPNGKLTCMFKTPDGTATAGSGTTLLNDKLWHTVRCDRTPTSVTMYVDGVRTGRANRVTGNLNNTKPWTLGGKLNCDPASGSLADSCDYFAGEIDYLTMTKG